MTTISTRTTLTALALAAAALTMTTLLAGSAASANQRGFGNQANQGGFSQTANCANFNCAPGAPVSHTPPPHPHPKPDPNQNGQPISGGGAGGKVGQPCLSDRDCGIFHQD